jgi:signal transduction histidine kinase
VLAVVVAVLIPSFGLVYGVVEPDAYDPMAHRIGFSLLLLAYAFALHRFAAARQRLRVLTLAVAGSFTLWFAAIAAFNAFSFSRVLGLFTLQVALAVVVQGAVRGAIAQGLFLFISAAALAAAPERQTHPATVLATMATVAVLAVAAAYVQERIVLELTQSQQALSRARDQLEERVRERTAELRREVEERTEAERAASAANAAKSHFLATMSHELRTPLNAVVGYSELLREDADASQAQDLDRVLVAARHLGTMIDDVLDLTRLEAGRLALTRERVDLSELVRRTIDTVRPQAATRGNTLTCTRPDDPLSTEGDPARLLQILINLAGNAVKFTEQGQVDIQVSQDEHTLKVSVVDTGPGIAPEALPHLFEAFYQVDGSRTRRHDGTGLGLAISQQLAALHGGHITVTSEVGKGSTFTLHLPRAPQPGAG